MADAAQGRVVEDVIEDVGPTPPRDLPVLHRGESTRGELRDQRTVFADVEIARENRGAANAGQLLGHQLALKGIRRAARPEHEEREQVRVEELQLAPKHVAPIIRRSVGVVFLPKKSNSIGGDGRSSRIVSRNGVREKIASPMPKGSSRGSAFG